MIADSFVIRLRKSNILLTRRDRLSNCFFVSINRTQIPKKKENVSEKAEIYDTVSVCIGWIRKIRAIIKATCFGKNFFINSIRRIPLVM